MLQGCTLRDTCFRDTPVFFTVTLAYGWGLVALVVRYTPFYLSIRRHATCVKNHQTDLFYSVVAPSYTWKDLGPEKVDTVADEKLSCFLHQCTYLQYASIKTQKPVILLGSLLVMSGWR